MRLVERLETLWLVNGHDRVFDGNPVLFAKLAEGTGDGFAGGAGHGGHFLVGEEKREAKRPIVEVLADLMAKLEQEATESGGHGFCKSDAAGILKGEAVFLADALDGAHLGFLVGAEEAEEAIAFDRPQLGGGERLGRDLIYTVREYGIEPEHGAWTGDPHDHLAILGAPGGQLDVTGADEIKAAGLIALGEERGLGGKGNGGGGEFEIG